MHYYEDKRGPSKKVILIVIVVVLILAIAVLVFLNLEKLRHFWQYGELPPEQTEVVPTEEPVTPSPEPLPPIDETANTIGTRFNVPAGFERVPVEEGSFAEYLRNFTLKSYGTVAKLHTGEDNLEAPTVGVFDQDIRKNGLQQCADAIIRLYAEYKYARGEYDDISFNFNNTPPFKCDFATWTTGQRVRVNGNKVEWYAEETATPGDVSYSTFRYYLDVVQQYANTDSLKAQLKRVDPVGLQIGDMFIVTAAQVSATEGHAILIVDMAVNPTTGEKIFICAEGNTPATETYILTNPNDGDSVWFSLNPDNSFTKSKYTYPADSIRRF